MNKFERWLFKRLLRKQLVQGNHINKLRQIHVDIRDIWKETFYEDNAPTIDWTLREVFEGTQHSPIVY